MEELGLSHILNAEGEKLQYVLGTLPGVTGPNPTIDELLQVNDSVQQTLSTAMQNQMFLQNKMSSALNASVMAGPTGPTGPTGATGAEQTLRVAPAGNATGGEAVVAATDVLKFSTSTLQMSVAGVAGGPVITIDGGVTDGTPLFNTRVGDAGTPVQMTAGSDLVFDTSTPDTISIDVATGSVVVDIKGRTVAAQYDETAAASYIPGQLVQYEGELYAVTAASPTSTPDVSEGFSLMLNADNAASIVGAGASGAAEVPQSVTDSITALQTAVSKLNVTANYSTTETETGAYFNGKKIYRRLFNVVVTAAIQVQTDTALISDAGYVGDIVNAGGNFYTGNLEEKYQISSSMTTASAPIYGFVFVSLDNKLTLRTESSQDRTGGRPASVWVDYTKFSDPVESV